MKKIILQTQKVFNGRYAFTLEVNFDSVEQLEDIIYYVKTDNYSVYKQNSSWYILDKITNIGYLETQLLNKTQLKELSNLVNKINKEFNSYRVKGQTYYYIDSELTIQKSVELLSSLDKIYYDLGNYFVNKKEAEEIALRLREFWNNIKEEKENSYIFRLSSNIKQINNISYDIQGKLLDKLLKICEIADRRLIEFTIHKGNVNHEIGVEIKFSQKMELKGIKDVEYVDIGENYTYAWVSTLRKYQLLNL